MSSPKNQKTRKATERWADSMAAAAAQMGLKLSEVKKAKRNGAPGFVGSRVDKDALREWLDALPPAPALEDGGLEDKETLERRKLRAQWLKEEFRLDVEKRKYIPVDEVRADMVRIASAQRAEDMRLVGDVGTWAGLSAVEMHERALAWFDEKCRALHDAFSSLYK